MVKTWTDNQGVIDKETTSEETIHNKAYPTKKSRIYFDLLSQYRTHYIKIILGEINGSPQEQVEDSIQRLNENFYRDLLKASKNNTQERLYNILTSSHLELFLESQEEHDFVHDPLYNVLKNKSIHILPYKEIKNLIDIKLLVDVLITRKK